MSSLFADAWVKASRNIDTYFGGSFDFAPMARVGGEVIPDVARAAMTITGAFDSVAALDDPVGQRNGAGMSKNVVAQVAAMHAAIDIANDALPYAPRAKDRLTRKRDGMIFEVSAVLQDDFARITLRVVKLGVSA